MTIIAENQAIWVKISCSFFFKVLAALCLGFSISEIITVLPASYKHSVCYLEKW